MSVALKMILLSMCIITLLLLENIFDSQKIILESMNIEVLVQKQLKMMKDMLSLLQCKKI